MRQRLEEASAERQYRRLLPPGVRVARKYERAMSPEGLRPRYVVGVIALVLAAIAVMAGWAEPEGGQLILALVMTASLAAVIAWYGTQAFFGKARTVSILVVIACCAGVVGAAFVQDLF